jgi:hypothetical protein
LKLQRLQNKVLRTTGNFPRRTFKIAHVYDYFTKLRRQQAEVIQNHHNSNVRNTGQGEAQRRKYKRLNLAAVKPSTFK